MNQTRDRILKATWSLLEDSAGHGVRMSDIAKAAKISRQAVYLHFPSRAELLIATTLYLDEIHDIENRLVASRTAETGLQRLNAWIEVWGSYIPTIHGIAKALMAMKDSDEEAAAAWDNRMQAMRHGCAAAISALETDNMLNTQMTSKEATDILFTLLSVRTWEQLRLDCNWSQKQYLDHMKRIAAQILLKTQD